MNRKRNLRNSEKHEDKEELEKINDELGDRLGKNNFNLLKTELNEIDSEKDINTDKIWKMKKKFSPKARDPPAAKKDASGNLITTSLGIKRLYIETYQNRLKPNTMKEGLEDLEESKQKLFLKIIDTASKNKTEPWTKGCLLYTSPSPRDS